MNAPAPPLVELRSVSRNFVKPLDLISRALNLVGASFTEEVVHAVDRVSFAIAEGEVVAVVGESGCGKSTVGRIVAGILRPSDGELIYRGTPSDRRAANPRAASRRVQMIFQNPFSSLNPRMRIRDAISEAPRSHGIVGEAEKDEYVDELMRRCGLDPAFKDSYPHQLSGGQRQRVVIARALAVKPEALVCDEAVAALDVSIQAQILNLFSKLREDLGLTYLFISHDLGVVEHISDRVIIMYLGRIVEIAPTVELFRSANHPYTQALLSDVLRIDQRNLDFNVIPGEIPSPLNPPSGCHFHPRCPHAFPRCRGEQPAIREIAPGRFSACHLND